MGKDQDPIVERPDYWFSVTIRVLSLFETIVVKAAVPVLIVYFLAGKTTIADLRGVWPGGPSAPWWCTLVTGLAVVFGALGGLYGWYQKKLLEMQIESTAPFVRRYEESLDPGRSSSKLTPRGNTRPEDK